ncbi:MAG: hypothetical protein J2O49_05970 [Sciscionella sp.]|nr:hypothetical protein [Sciscionella sp.]
MEWIFGIVALVVALAGLGAALAHAGYLYLLGSAANRRGGGEPIAQYVRSRWQVAGVTTAAGVIGVLFTLGGFTPDVIGLVIGAGTAAASAKALEATKHKFRGDIPRSG